MKMRKWVAAVCVVALLACSLVALAEGGAEDEMDLGASVQEQRSEPMESQREPQMPEASEGQVQVQQTESDPVNEATQAGPSDTENTESDPGDGASEGAFTLNATDADESGEDQPAEGEPAEEAQGETEQETLGAVIPGETEDAPEGEQPEATEQPETEATEEELIPPILPEETEVEPLEPAEDAGDDMPAINLADALSFWQDGEVELRYNMDEARGIWVAEPLDGEVRLAIYVTNNAEVAVGPFDAVPTALSELDAGGRFRLDCELTQSAWGLVLLPGESAQVATFVFTGEGGDSLSAEPGRLAIGMDAVAA